MDSIIRRASLHDWKIIQKLNFEVFEDNKKYDEHIIEDWAYSSAGEKYFQKATSDPSYLCIIAELDSQPVGYLIASPKEIDYRMLKTMELSNMGVSPEFRSKGIGQQLVDTLKKWSKENGYTSVYVNAYAKNEKALAFYQRNGFSIIDIALEVIL